MMREMMIAITSSAPSDADGSDEDEVRHGWLLLRVWPRVVDARR